MPSTAAFVAHVLTTHNADGRFTLVPQAAVELPVVARLDTAVGVDYMNDARNAHKRLRRPAKDKISDG